jgi:hypothetical protein
MFASFQSLSCLSFSSLISSVCSEGRHQLVRPLHLAHSKMNSQLLELGLRSLDPARTPFRICDITFRNSGQAFTAATTAPPATAAA